MMICSLSETKSIPGIKLKDNQRDITVELALHKYAGGMKKSDKLDSLF
jgi:hypothetical protein